MTTKGRRIVLGHVHDVRQTVSLSLADPLSVFRIVDALDPPSREVDFDQLVAAAVERVRRRFSSRGRNQGNKYARVAYAWLKHRKWQAVSIPRRTFFHALKKVKDFFYAQKIRVKRTFRLSRQEQCCTLNAIFALYPETMHGARSKQKGYT